MNRRPHDTVVGVIGDHCLDIDFLGSDTGIMSRELETMQIFGSSAQDVRYSGGGAANIVDLLQEWNVRVLPCGLWNPDKDTNSHALYQNWMSGFVDFKHMVYGPPTPAYIKFYTHDGEHVFRVNVAVPFDMSLVQDQLINHIQRLNEEIDILIVADYDEGGNGILTHEILSTIDEFITCPKIGMSRTRLRQLQGYDYLILNEEELLNETDEDSDIIDLERIFDLMRMTKSERILLTLKGEGAALFEGKFYQAQHRSHIENGFGHAELVKISVPSSPLTQNINVCGCGDTFTAAFTISIAAGMSEIESMKNANAAARAQARKLNGAHVVSHAECLAEYEELYGKENDGRESKIDTNEVVSIKASQD